MCGRFAFFSPREAVVRLFAVEDGPEIEPRYNLSPTQFVPVVREAGGSRHLSLLHWGLIPHWAKDRSFAAHMINARSETVAEKPAFRTAFKQRRCLVLADGYYEWQSSAAGKQPFFIRHPSAEPLALAGLWESWRDPAAADAASLESCSIVTAAANHGLEKIHQRMPVVLAAAAWSQWLNPELRDPEPLQALLQNASGQGLQAIAVSTRVNNSRNQGLELIAPLTESAAP
jgi:putative SOS response-associated peptidase YedK